MAAQPKLIPLTPFDVLDKAIPRTWLPMIGGPTQGNYKDNTKIQFTLQQDGYASRMMLATQVLVTVAGTVSGGTIKGPGKYAVGSNLLFGPNGSTLLRNHSFWGGYKHNRYRHGFDFNARGKADTYSEQALSSLGITQSGGAPQILTTVTSGATSATQTLGSTAGIVPGAWVYFATAALYRQVQSITSATVLVLTASITSTTGENVTLANGSNAGGLLAPVAGSLIQAGTYVLNVMQPLDIAYNRVGQACLLDLNNQSIYTLTTQCGNLISSLGSGGGDSDLFSGLTGSGLTYTATGTQYASYETFPYLRTDVYEYSDQYRQVLTVLEQDFQISKGKNPITIPRGDQYSMVLAEFKDSSGNPLKDSDFTGGMGITYGGSQVMQDQDRLTHLLQSYVEHNGLPAMNGVWDIDLGLRTGQLDLRDTYDNFRNDAINNWTFTPVLGSAATGGTATFTMECLQDA